MNPAVDVWEKVLMLLKEQLTETAVKTWFADVEPVALEESRFVLYIPSSLTADIVRKRYLDDIKAALKELFSADLDVLILGEGEREKYTLPSEEDRFLPGAEGYTFERFVVGSSNKFAHAAALAVSQKPGESYNPLFIHGESGLGKTHLLYAIAHAVHKEHPGYRIVYIRGDAFTNELIDAIQKGKNKEFRNKYRTADVFLMDDVQFIAGRDSTQEEMFHTFNALYEEHKQIVFTADRPPKEMLRLEDRLRTRFEWGLLADVQPPDYETRVAILKSKAIRMGLELPESVLQYVAENITANVRQIEGIVNKISAIRDLEGDINGPAVIRAVQEMLKDISDILPTPPVIIEEVCKFFNVEEGALRGQSRTKEIATARHIAIYLIRTMTKLSLQDIGKEFGNRNHTTILNSVERVEKLCKDDPTTGEILKDIKTNVNDRLG